MDSQCRNIMSLLELDRITDKNAQAYSTYTEACEQCSE